ncbi:MAG: DUF115 domain-containing protein [Treponema sp.]|nr:DUF115 domain-containing protein [Treponema sp.]
MSEIKRYTFLKSRSGENIPAFILPNGDTHPLHSTIDPIKEAQRLIASSGKNDFLIFLGLGGGFAPLAALENTNSRVIAIDFNKTEIEELLAGMDYSKLLNNSRFNLLVDFPPQEIKTFIMENFNPSLYNGIKTIPLRARIDQDTEKFNSITAIIKEAIDAVSGDYSVQAHFGIRWFSNIISNIQSAEKQNSGFLTEIKKRGIKNAAIAAAGPSLDTQLTSLARFKSQGGFIISSDTALRVLLHNNIEADAVVSIDCQYISYYHFHGLNMRHIPLILDIASPPLLCGLSSAPVFFSSGHPLCRYLNSNWKHFPYLDTSGGNVTYACLSLAEYLGAQNITLFGADFSYVKSQSYARGTYIYPYFHNRQNRLSSLEAQMSRFLYRSPFLPQENEQKNYYETSQLRFYRKKLEEKVSGMSSSVTCEAGLGARIYLENSSCKKRKEDDDKIIYDNNISGKEFLETYRDDILTLPQASDKENYLLKLNVKEKQIFTTLLPLMAAVKKRNPQLEFKDLTAEAKRRSAGKIDLILTNWSFYKNFTSSLLADS